MRAESLFRLLFVVYCVEAGLFLLVSPWTPSWSRLFELLPWAQLRHLALAPWARGAIAGFGLVHLIWALHDLDLLLRRVPAGGPPAPPERGV